MRGMRLGRGRLPRHPDGPIPTIPLPDENLRARRPLYLIAVALILFSGPLRQPVVFIAGLLLLALAFTPELWYRFGLRALRVQREPAITRAVFGDLVEMPLLIENRKPLPLPWVEISDEFPDELPVVGVRLAPSPNPERALLVNSVSLWAYERLRRRFRVRAVARGAFFFGPMVVRVSDPFGMLIREERQEAHSRLLIYPLIVPIERFGLPPEAPFGERRSAQRRLEDPLRIAGVRDYAPGDEPRRIHWKATARAGRLQSKLFDPSGRHVVAIFVDVRTYFNPLIGYNPNLLELAISAAASVASWAINQGYAVSLGSNGTLAELDDIADIPVSIRNMASAELSDGDGAEQLERLIARKALSMRLRVPASARPEQLSRVLDGLARLQPYYGVPMHRVLASERSSLPTGATVVYIGSEPAVDVPVIVALRQFREHGHAVTLLIARSDGEAQGEAADLHLADLRTHYIGGEARWEQLVRDVIGEVPIRRAALLGGNMDLIDRERRALRDEAGEDQRPVAPDGQGGSEHEATDTDDTGARRGLRPSGIKGWVVE